MAEPVEKKEFQCKKYFCTVNNPTIPLTLFCEKLQGLGATKGVVQLEVGDEEQTPHFQGAFEFATVKRASTLNKIQKGTYTNQRLVETGKKGPYSYCCKEHGRLEGPIQWGLPFPEVLVHGLEERIAANDLAPWQTQLFGLIKEPCTDNRTVWWYWSDSGAKGKTSTARYIFDQGETVYVSLSADKGASDRDIKCAIGAAIDPDVFGSRRDPILVRKVIIDIPRAATIDYSLIETIKNGIFFNSKYKPCPVRYNSPHVIVFANWPPDDTGAGIGAARLEVINLD